MAQQLPSALPSPPGGSSDIGPRARSYFPWDFTSDEDSLWSWRGVALLGAILVAEAVLFGIVATSWIP